MHRIASVVAGLSLAFVGTSATIAATINVNPGESIQAAINASSNGDVINIAAGTYNEYNLNPGGKAITIQGTLNGDGSLATTIDANHDYDAVVADLRAWRPKVKPGGVLAGHNYDAQWPDVVRAVDELTGGPEQTFQDTSWAVRLTP
ncbi:MAG: class I SAM-dependent methyltransferase [Phycisphaerales bacterium]|nr:class I SAM-dependent methyltransferase [Phycisphaerales bacterium]